MENLQVEQFLVGFVAGLAIRSTDLLPVAVGAILGYYVSSKKIDVFGTASNFLAGFMPPPPSKNDKNNKK